MKKALLLLPLLLFTSCKETSEQKQEITYCANFVELCQHDTATRTILYLKDEDTNIIYIMFMWGYRGGISVYYNEKGQPMTYEEFDVVHNEKYHKGEQK
jgi:hypothetical protein